LGTSSDEGEFWANIHTFMNFTDFYAKLGAKQMLDSIQYKDEFFPIRSIYVSGWGNVLISTDELQDKLLIDSGDDYQDSIAQSIDEKIFYFVTHEQLQMTEEVLSKTIKAEIEQ
jgi:isocitrate lyase